VMILDPQEMDVKLNSKKQVGEWQHTLRKHLYQVRGGCCDKCGRLLSLHAFRGLPNAVETHEAIASKADVRGWRLPRKAWIFTEVNTLVLCPTCHRPQPPTRQWSWDYMCERYGVEAMERWYYGLPWKVKPRRF